MVQAEEGNENTFDNLEQRLAKDAKWSFGENVSSYARDLVRPSTLGRIALWGSLVFGGAAAISRAVDHSTYLAPVDAAHHQLESYVDITAPHVAEDEALVVDGSLFDLVRDGLNATEYAPFTTGAQASLIADLDTIESINGVVPAGYLLEELSELSADIGDQTNSGLYLGLGLALLAASGGVIASFSNQSRLKYDEQLDERVANARMFDGYMDRTRAAFEGTELEDDAVSYITTLYENGVDSGEFLGIAVGLDHMDESYRSDVLETLAADPMSYDSRDKLAVLVNEYREEAFKRSLEDYDRL